MKIVFDNIAISAKWIGGWHRVERHASSTYSTSFRWVNVGPLLFVCERSLETP